MEKSIFEKWAVHMNSGETIFSPALSYQPKRTAHRHMGQRHLRYLKEYRRATYITLLTSGRLNSYLADVDRQAQTLFFRLVKAMTEQEGITEQLKTEKQMEMGEKIK